MGRGGALPVGTGSRHQDADPEAADLPRVQPVGARPMAGVPRRVEATAGAGRTISALLLGDAVVGWVVGVGPGTTGPVGVDRAMPDPVTGVGPRVSPAVGVTGLQMVGAPEIRMVGGREVEMAGVPGLQVVAADRTRLGTSDVQVTMRDLGGWDRGLIVQAGDRGPSTVGSSARPVVVR